MVKKTVKTDAASLPPAKSESVSWDALVQQELSNSVVDPLEFPAPGDRPVSSSGSGEENKENYHGEEETQRTPNSRKRGTVLSLSSSWLALLVY